jgi:hypothetical protein
VIQNAFHADYEAALTASSRLAKPFVFAGSRQADPVSARFASHSLSVLWTTPAEAIRRAILLPAGKPPAWLRELAATAEQQLLADSRADGEGSTEGDGVG